MGLGKTLMHGLPVLALLLFLAFYNFSTAPLVLMSSTALSAVVVVGITFIIGPLSRFVKAANRYKAYRKYLGLSAFALMVLHAALALVFYYDLDIVSMLSAGKQRTLQVYSALIAFFIFFLMSITSNQMSIKLLGPRNWKLLQTTGYVAMAFVMLHFMLANTQRGVFEITRLYAAIAFLFGIIVILARILVLALVAFEKKPSMKR